MEIEQKQKALKQLAQIEGEKVVPALQKECERIASQLNSETQYAFLEDQLELLDAFAFRVSEETLSILQEYLKRLEKIIFTYPSDLGFSEEVYKEYHNKTMMTVKVLEILEHIKYFQPEKILAVFLKCSINSEEKIRKRAIKGLENLSEYNIDVVYGNENWKGLGVSPQMLIVEKLQSFSEAERLRYFDPIVILCKNLLSPSMSGTSWDYKSVTWKTGAVPAENQVKDIREKTLALLMKCYQSELTIKQKLSLISGLISSTRPHRSFSDDRVAEMIQENIQSVFIFFENIIPNEKLQILQKIEHYTYWIYYHRGVYKNVEAQALKIKKQLDGNNEYQIYKVLVGFEGVFDEWSQKKEDKKDFESRYKQRDELRTRKGQEYAEGITEDNFEEWESRIIEFSSTESEDLATFPYFAKFLEHFCVCSPELGLRLLRNQIESLERFVLPIFLGLWKSDKQTIRSLLSEWISEGLCLRPAARIFEFDVELDEELLKEILKKATAIPDRLGLIQIMSSVASKYDSNKKHLIGELFIPAVKALISLNEAGWVFDFWYQSKKDNILADLEGDHYEIVLENMLALGFIDFNVEEALITLSKRYPEKVVSFFGKRLKKEGDERSKSSFEAVPYDFQELHKELSKIPEKVVPIVREWYDGNYGMFVYRGARFLKIIFPTFPEAFQNQLIEMIKTGEEDGIRFVMAILRNYEGQEFLHPVCKALINALSEEEELLTEVRIILESAGVVSGEYGHAEAYERKKKEVEVWLSDKSEKVRKFAENYIAGLEKLIESERNRVNEDVELRKHQFGDNESTNES